MVDIFLAKNFVTIMTTFFVVPKVKGLLTSI